MGAAWRGPKAERPSKQVVRGVPRGSRCSASRLRDAPPLRERPGAELRRGLDYLQPQPRHGPDSTARQPRAYGDRLDRSRGCAVRNQGSAGNRGMASARAGAGLIAVLSRDPQPNGSRSRSVHVDAPRSGAHRARLERFVRTSPAPASMPQSTVRLSRGPPRCRGRAGPCFLAGGIRFFTRQASHPRNPEAARDRDLLEKLGFTPPETRHSAAETFAVVSVSAFNFDRATM